MTVRELVALGRFPHRSVWGAESKADRLAVEAALARAGVEALQGRTLQTLSGGQRQRAWIAMALAQEAEVMLLDEPTTFLDPAHQLEVLELVDHLRDALGRTLILVLHDINHAARHADHVVALKAGRIVVEGPPASVITKEHLRAVFDIDADVFTHPATGRTLCVPLGRMPERAP
ncbi:MAG: ABC transporter ATP-binding protein [Myxococcales bacterium]